MSNNQISYIMPSAFANCTPLKDFNVEGNFLNFTTNSTPPQVFINLQNLTVLRTRWNRAYKGPSYLKTFCIHLKKLTVLSVDIVTGMHFPPECKSLEQLRTLVLNVRWPVHLKNSSLRELTGLPIHDLSLYGNSYILHPIEADFFKPVENVKNLLVDHRGRKANIRDTLGILLHPYRNKHMESLVLQYIRDTVSIELKNDDYKYLKTICVKKLSLRNNYIMKTNFNGMLGSNLWRCLEDVDISYNMDYQYDNSYMFLLSLPRLKKLNMCCQRIIRANLITSSSSPRNESKSKPTIKYGIDVHGLNVTLNMPDSLEWISFAHIDWRRNVFDFNLTINAKNLKFMDASYLLIDDCRGRVFGMTSLRTLRIQMWNCSSINPEFISHLTSVTSLVFSSLNLGHNVLTQPLLQNLSRLNDLNISDNKITDLKSDFFRSQMSSLKRLDISYNKLHHLPTSLMALDNIEYLDLRFNKLTSFLQTEMLFLEKEKLLLKLEGNILECSCGSISFLRWIKSNKGKIQDFDILKCLDDKGILRNLTYIVTNLRHKQMSCISKLWLYLSTSGMIVLLSLLTISTILYKFRADARYLYARLRRFMRRKQKCVQLIEKYHAFLSYESSNYEWPVHTLLKTLESRGFRVCVPDRDFNAGTDEVDNIIDSIDNSKRVIFVLTHDFLENDWCEWHIKLARIHAFRNDNENFIIVIIKDDLKSHEIPKSLKKIWIRVNCLRWPLDEDSNLIEEFWKKLEDSLSAD